MSLAGAYATSVRRCWSPPAPKSASATPGPRSCPTPPTPTVSAMEPRRLSFGSATRLVRRHFLFVCFLFVFCLWRDRLGGRTAAAAAAAAAHAANQTYNRSSPHSSLLLLQGVAVLQGKTYGGPPLSACLLVSRGWSRLARLCLRSSTLQPPSSAQADPQTSCS